MFARFQNYIPTMRDVPENVSEQVDVGWFRSKIVTRTKTIVKKVPTTRVEITEVNLGLIDFFEKSGTGTLISFTPPSLPSDNYVSHLSNTVPVNSPNTVFGIGTIDYVSSPVPRGVEAWISVPYKTVLAEIKRADQMKAPTGAEKFLAFDGFVINLANIAIISSTNDGSSFKFISRNEADCTLSLDDIRSRMPQCFLPIVASPRLG